MENMEPSSEEMAAEILALAGRQEDATFSGEIREAYRRVALHPNPRAIQLCIARGLPTVASAPGAGMLSIWLGAFVENGADPDETAEPLMETMVRWCRELSDSPDRPSPEPLLNGLQFLGQGLVAHLGASRPLVERFRADETVVNELARVAAMSIGANWVREMLEKTSGTLLVIETERQRGAIVKYENLSNSFHLFTLLQESLREQGWSGRQTSQEVLESARGTAQHEVTDVAWWHYGRGDVPKADIHASVWGELSPDQLPLIDGQQVLLLWPAILKQREWDSGFFYPFLSAASPKIEFVRPLTVEEVETWWNRLQLPRETRRWWQFWS